MKKALTRTAAVVALSAVTLQFTACGTLMYPERRGQRSGEIDIKVAVLDGIGLLFFIIPGVIAYAVDFSTGAIYLPHGKRNMVDGTQYNPAVIHVSQETLNDPDRIHAVVAESAGLPAMVNWNSSESVSIRPEEVTERLALAAATGFSELPGQRTLSR